MHQNQNLNVHRRGLLLEKRQLLTRVEITTTITRPQTTVTLTGTVISTIQPTPATSATTSRTTSKADESTTSRTTRASTSASSTTSATTSSSSSTISLTTPTSSSSSATTPTTPTTSLAPTPSAKGLTSASSSGTASLPSHSANSDNANTSSSSKSAGTVAGIVAGVLIGVVALAIFAAFVVRRLRRARDQRRWDADKFRRSALILNDENEKQSHTPPRPPSMIANKVANRLPTPATPSQAYPYSDTASQFGDRNYAPSTFDTNSVRQFGSDAGYGQQFDNPRQYGPQTPQPYGAPSPFGAPPMPYSGQNMYNQFPDRGYGPSFGPNPGMPAGVGMDFGATVGTPAQYAPYSSQLAPIRPDQRGYPSYNGQQQQQPPQPQSPFVPGQATNANAIPNPFMDKPMGSPVVPASQPRTSASNSPPAPPPKSFELMQDIAQEQGNAPPPAYSDPNGKYADLQRDTKAAPVVTSVQAPTSAPVQPSAPAQPSTPVQPSVPVQSPAPEKSDAPTARPVVSNKDRPMSSHTVYDPSDAYDGI